MGGQPIYPNELKILLGSLTPKQVKALKKDNPFKKERDRLIRELARKGVGYPLLAKASGLSKSTVHRIGTKAGENYREKHSADMKRVKAAFSAFRKALQTFLDKEGGEKCEKTNR